MKKRDIELLLNVTLKDVDEDSEFTLCDGELKEFWHFGEPEFVCGKGQQWMPYYCVRKKDHDGDCYCSCKNVYFNPD